MSEVEQPAWLQNYNPTHHSAKQNTNWQKGMPSPNPNGRPKGVIDKRTKLTQILLDDAPAIARVVIDAALMGDIQAAGIVLSRVAPALKPQSECVKFNFDAKASLTCQVEAVVQAIANGDLPPDVGKQIVEVIASLGAVRQLDEFENRIAALEKKRNRS